MSLPGDRTRDLPFPEADTLPTELLGPVDRICAMYARNSDAIIAYFCVRIVRNLDFLCV